MTQGRGMEIVFEFGMGATVFAAYLADLGRGGGGCISMVSISLFIVDVGNTSLDTSNL